MSVADLAKVTARVLWIIGARSSSFNDTVSDDRFIQEEVRRAIYETEAELVRAICESYHPMRTSFLAWSADLNNGDPVPAHIGQIEAVKIKPYTAGSYELAESTSRENIKLWRTNTNDIFDAIDHNVIGSSLAGYYNVTNNIITFTGNVAQVNICTYASNYSTTLDIDDQFDGALVAGSIPRLNKIGLPQALVLSYGTMYGRMMSEIRQGLTLSPEIGVAQAID